MATINVSGLSFFMPIFSFLFVFLIVYALLAKTKIIGESKLVHILISFIVAIVFISFSSLELYVRTIMPWFVVLIVIVFFVLLIAAFSTKSWDKIMTPGFAWVAISILLIIFVVAAVKVFNPVLHANNSIITSGGSGSGIFEQLRDWLINSTVAGSILLIIVAIAISWVITKK